MIVVNRIKYIVVQLKGMVFMSTGFKKVEDIREYAMSLKSNVYFAHKIGAVQADKVSDPDGADITVYSAGTGERVVHAERGDWIVTALDNNFEPLEDEAGHTHQRIMKDDIFSNSYIREGGHFIPNPERLRFKRLIEDIVYRTPEGVMVSIPEGGFLDITKPDEIYGIEREEFFATHKCVAVGMLVNQSDYIADKFDSRDNF